MYSSWHNSEFDVTELNILFTCAGRRNYLINYFKEALNHRGKTIAVDTLPSAPALMDADIGIVVPNINDPNYIDTLKLIVKNYHVKAIISLNDLELPLLSKFKNEIETLGVKVLVSNENIIETSSDKWKTYKYFKKLQIDTPLTYLSMSGALEAIDQKVLQFPLILKPRWGSSSIGVEIVENVEELRICFEFLKIRLQKSILNDINSKDIDNSILIQEKINGEEYGIDILNDFNGKYYSSFVRKKLAMRSGETDQAISVIDEKFSQLGKKIGTSTMHLGNMDCDFFVANEKIYFLEMNPRFGGGYPFSHEAGIHTPDIYIAWLQGFKDVSKYDNYIPNLTFSKCDRLISNSRMEKTSIQVFDKEKLNLF